MEKGRSKPLSKAFKTSSLYVTNLRAAFDTCDDTPFLKSWRYSVRHSLITMWTKHDIFFALFNRIWLVGFLSLILKDGNRVWLLKAQSRRGPSPWLVLFSNYWKRMLAYCLLKRQQSVAFAVPTPHWTTYLFLSDGRIMFAVLFFANFLRYDIL